MGRSTGRGKVTYSWIFPAPAKAGPTLGVVIVVVVMIIGSNNGLEFKANGSLERLKARLVARGFTQRHGANYEEVFSSVVKMTTIRNIIALTA